MYFNNFRNKEIKVNHSSIYYNEYDNYYNEFSFDKIFYFDNYINFI